MANWFRAPLLFCIGIVHRFEMLHKARYISLKTASSFGNSARFLLTFRSAALSDSIVFVVLTARLVSAVSP
jgi:hypothetical protein